MGGESFYYYLNVVNSRRWALARNCRVLLREIYRRGPDHQFRAAPVPVPPQFVWAPAELTPIVINLAGEQVLDFGRVVEGASRFEPVLYSYPNDFQGFLSPDEAVRYRLEAVADGSPVGPSHVYEVAWNGRWSDNLGTMEQNLTITEVHDTGGAV